MEWSITNVTDPNVNHQKLVLKCTTTYLFKVKAWNEEGGSDSPSKAWPITTGESEPHAQTDKDASSAGMVPHFFHTTGFICIPRRLLLNMNMRLMRGLSRKYKDTQGKLRLRYLRNRSKMLNAGRI